ncbi:hypothetical protein AB0D32_16120 [Micromonospora sp. NPDC048170]|uniref:hypothetical protein n=1 Tax=Micromonospora sp. NPDC048170 TaxID=3154819 RepID=UPI0033F9D099
MPGHVGWTYQGHNATYLGRTTATRQILLPDGTSLPGRAISKLTSGDFGSQGVAARLRRLGAPPPAGEPLAVWLPRALTVIGASTIRHPGKHKYAWQIHHSPAARLAQPARPYPRAIDPTQLHGGNR